MSNRAQPPQNPTPQEVTPDDFSLNDLLAWSQFHHGLKTRNRFILDKTAEKFVRGLVHFARSSKSTKIKQGQKLFRARINPDQIGNRQRPLSKEEMSAPPSEKAIAGRLNPDGIPYLYLASREETALAEVRPWLDAVVTIAEVVISQEITVVDVANSVSTDTPSHDQSNKQQRAAETSWRELVSYAFSMPVQPNHAGNYIPTQYLAETFKAEAFHGVKYNSSLGPEGFNVALFDPKLAEIGRTYLVLVKGVKYSYVPKS